MILLENVFKNDILISYKNICSDVYIRILRIEAIKTNEVLFLQFVIISINFCSKKKRNL